MKKTATSIITLLILTVLFAVGMSFSALAEGETAVWDDTNFGNATWAEVDGATYKVTLLYNSDFTGSSYETVCTKTFSDSSVTSYDFIPEDKIGGEITAEKLGKYKFEVETTVGEETTTATSAEKDFVKLYAPITARWNVTSSDIIAEWTHNSLNSVSAGYPALDKISYKWELTNLSDPSARKPTQSLSNGLTYLNANNILRNLSGRFVFSIYATSEFAFNSDVYTLRDLDALTYPIVISTPESASWGSVSSAGIAQWTPVTGASSYLVTFYKAEPSFDTVVVYDGKIQPDDFTVPEGSTSAATKPNMIVSYTYKQVGTPQRVNASSNTVANTQCDIANVKVQDSGVYFFSVVAEGQNNATPSAPAGFDISKFPNSLLKTYTYKKDGTSPYVNDLDRNAQLASDLGSGSSVPASVIFNFVRAGDIRVDLNDDDVVDDVQNNLTLFLPIGDSKTIGAFRFISSSASSEKSTDVPLEWNSTQSASLATLSYFGDKLTLTGLNEGVFTLKVTAKYSPYASKEIKVFVSRKPTKLTISGRNSFIVNEGSYKLQLAIEPSSASSDTQYFKWSSTDNTVVSVENGIVTPTTTALSASPKYAEITVESLLAAGISSTFRVAVSNEGIMPARIDVVGNNTVPLKSTLQLSAEVYSDVTASANSIFVTNKDITWSSSNEKVATVDQKGKVTPKALGKCTITATSKATNSSHVKGNLQIEVVPEEINITRLSLSGTKTLTVGEQTDIKLTISPTNATDRDIVWRCSGGGNISYKSELVRTLTATEEGTATITVYADNAPSIKAELVVTVKSASEKPETDVGKTEITSNIKPTPGTGDKKNEYTADVNEAVLNEAINKVFAEAKPLKTTPVVRVKVATPNNAVSAIVKIPRASVYNIINYYGYRDEGVLVIETGIGTVAVPPYALRSIYNQVTNNTTAQNKTIDFRMTKVANTSLNDRQQKAADGRSVLEFLIVSGGSEISRFGGYAVNVSIPFSLTSTQSGKGVQVDYLDKNGYLSGLSTSYDYKTKTVNFDTTHFSLYIPYYYAAVAWDNPFTDVSTRDWYYDSVFYVVDRELMRGISADRFVPASYTTRAMVVTILHRLAGSPPAEQANTFVDVKENQWYTEAVLWATENELVSGYGGAQKGRFGPDDRVTREQLGVMLHNYAKFVDITPQYGWDTPMRYPDSYNVSPWARQGAMYCQITGIIGGRPGGGFDPQGVATRSELATMLLRMNEQMEEQLSES